MAQETITTQLGEEEGSSYTFYFLIAAFIIFCFFPYDWLEKMGCKKRTPRAVGRHLLVSSETQAHDIKAAIEAESSTTEAFGRQAELFSTCPSKARGGYLGEFKQGAMVPAFDACVFNPDTQCGVVNGPIQTNFGWHLIMIDERKYMENESLKTL